MGRTFNIFKSEVRITKCFQILYLRMMRLMFIILNYLLSLVITYIQFNFKLTLRVRLDVRCPA